MRGIGKILGIATVFWVGTILAFISYVTLERQSNTVCNNVVVLTGDSRRITHAFNLVKSSGAKNIFISGVYEKTLIKDIWPREENSGNSKVFLGKQAKNTSENAQEINEWVKRNNVSEILLITSDYHIPRSMMELKYCNNSLQVHPYGVKSEFDRGFIWRCVKELHKIAYAFIKNFIKLNFSYAIN
ncbi:MAG: YdcF family protein [Holosporaceae bacterium]|jgi:uncharacterized SAM-binding protein YcdF (DUF218 family)|nr:YdcF family protein [Holosporaceae bacterium]